MNRWRPESAYDYWNALWLKRRIGKQRVHVSGGWYMMTCGHRRDYGTIIKRLR